jgi:arylsulfatase A-like enzyme
MLGQNELLFIQVLLSKMNKSSTRISLFNNNFNLMKTNLILAISFCLFAFGCTNSASKEKTAPNIILILADDQGWGATGVQVHPDMPRSASDFISTPNLVQLAKNGMSFSNGYAPHPNCSPSRASIQLGKTPARIGMTNIVERPGGASTSINTVLNPPLNVQALPSEDITIAEQIKKYRPEYVTAHFGKWHLAGGGPENHGYDIHDGETTNREGNRKEYKDNPKDIFGITARGNKWMEEQVKAGKPFYMQLSHYATHLKLQSRKSTRKSYSNKEAGKRHNNVEHAAMTSDLDTGIGELLDKVKELGIEDNTYIIYMADNGSFPFLNPENTCGPIRGWKANLWEGGIRSPFIVAGPHIKPGTKSDVRVSGWDLFPTICDWLDITELPEELDGGSIKPILEEKDEKEVKRADDFMVFYWPCYVIGKGGLPTAVIYKGDYKLHKFYETGELRLYNIKEDIAENNVLNDSQPEKLKELEKDLEGYLDKVGAERPVKNSNFDPKTDSKLEYTKVIDDLMNSKLD